MGKVTYMGAMPPDDPLFSSGVQMFSVRRYPPPATANSLPDAPERGQFKTEDEYLEAMGRWQETVGRIKAMAARSSKNKE